MNKKEYKINFIIINLFLICYVYITNIIRNTNRNTKLMLY